MTWSKQVTSSPLQAKVRKISQWSPIWIVPVAAVLIGSWMLYHSLKNQGAVVTLLASNAEGLVAGKTQIKSRSVDIGKVMSVELSQDLKQVVIRARMNPGTDALLNDESQLWVVKPTVGRGGVSGLSTLLSGAYIELQPGKSSQNKVFFELLETPPLAPPDAPGIRVSLSSSDAAALAVGDPVLYRGYDVGTVERSEFDMQQRLMRYQLFIRAPYDSLVTENVRFWKASGMALDMSAEGVRVEMASVTTLLGGGVTFDVLEGWPQGEPAKANADFALFANKKSIQEGLYRERLEYLLFFDESIRGLAAGAPVEYRGVRIGTVASVPYFFKMKNPLQVAFSKGIPVLIHIESGRLYDNLTLAQLSAELEAAVGRGLVAVLKTGNLLTGGLYVDLNQQEPTTATTVQQSAAATAPTATTSNEAAEPAGAAPLSAASAIAEPLVTDPLPADPLAVFAGYKTLPTARSGLGHIEQKVLQALDKVNNLPVEKVLADSSATLQATTALLQQSQQLVESLDKLTRQEQVQQLPKELQQTLTELRKTLTGLSPGSPVYERLNSNLQSMDKVLRDLQPVVQTLNQQSNALVLGAQAQSEPEPEQGNQP